MTDLGHLENDGSRRVAMRQEQGRSDAESLGERSADDSTSRSRSWIVVLPLAIGAAFLLWRGPQLIDDAFITMRYSIHLAHGDGAVFNVGQRVEGFSNPLWMAILGAASFLGLSLPVVALVAASLAFLGVVYLTWRLAAAAGAGTTAAVVAAILVAASSNIVGATLNGLETSLFALGLTATVYLVTRDPLPRAWLAVALVVVAFSRPEGIPLALVILLISYLARRRWSLEVAFYRPLAIASVLVVGAAIAARWAYYGDLLPMSVIAKHDLDTDPVHSLVRATPDGLLYVIHSLGKWWLLLMGTTVLFLVVRWRPRTSAARVAVTVSLAAGAVGAFVSISNGGDWMANARLLVPYLPAGIAVLAAGLSDTTRSRYVVFAWAILAITLQPWTFGPNWQPIDHTYDTVSRRLAEAAHPGESVSTNVLGHLGFRSPSLLLFDLHGLTEPSIAKLPERATVYGKIGTAIVASRHDPVIALNTWKLLVDVVHASDVPYVGVVSTDLERGNAFIALRADSADRFAAALAESYPIEVVPFDQAVAEWRTGAPDGQNPTAGP